jgi:CHAD domain-containing protein
MAKGQESDLDPAQSYRSAMKELIGARWGAVWNAVPVAIAGEDIEGVHQVRVASRRLRAAMDVAVGCFPDSWYRPLHKVAKDITGALGEVRDRDVLLEFFERDRDTAAPGEKPGINRLIQRVYSERELARGRMIAFLSQLESKDIVGETIRRFGSAAAGKELSNGRAPQ